MNAAAEEKIVKKEEIFKEKIESLKSRKKGEKGKNVDARIVNLESTLAEIEEEKGALQLKLVELEDIAGIFRLIVILSRVLATNLMHFSV